MQRLPLNVSFLNRLAMLPLFLGLWLGWTVSPALAQAPVNDYFTNATVLTGQAGSIGGSTVGATMEAGENFILGFPGGHSVWYTWTAPADGQYTFSTLGSSFDTLLGVYTGTNVNALSIVGENDDVSLLGDPSSKVTFSATNGAVFYIAVDGFYYTMGNIMLSWQPYARLAAGSFRFTSAASNPNAYVVSEWEAIAPENVHMLATPGARLTVTRENGNAGRVWVYYTVTNAWYTNRLRTQIAVEDITISDSTGQSNHYLTTNIVVTAQYQNNERGTFTYLPDFVMLTNIVEVDGVVSPPVVLLDIGTNVPALNCGRSITNVVSDTNANPVLTTTYVTNLFCTNYILTNIVAAAEPFVDYFPESGALVFDDYQMSADILVTVLPNNPAPLVVNRLLTATIDQVMLDPMESTNISPPLSLVTNTLVNILDHNVIPGLGRLGTNILTFERSTLRCDRNVDGQRVAHVAVMRSTIDASGSCTVPYRIDFLFPNANANNTFRPQAGSDYATPPNPGAGKYGINPDFESVTGTLSWGQNDLNVKWIDIPITNYNLVEFNQDLMIELYYPPGPKPTDYTLGYVNTCVLTILFNDLRNGPQPAGAVDRMHNMNADASTIPAYNLTPGANSTVYALGAQTDGRTLLAGDFTAFNTIPRNRIARMLPNGQIDSTFDPKDGADQVIRSLVLDSYGNIVVGGDFSSYNRVARGRVARLTGSGALDTSFNPGLGANGHVWQVAMQNGTNILIAGEFTAFDGFTRHSIARLKSDGSLDPSFDPGDGPNGPIYAMAPLPDGRIVIGGQFSSVAGVSRSCIARLNPDGSLDTSFNPRSGAGGPNPVVYALGLQSIFNDTKVLVGGNFNAMYGLPRNNLARLNSDGSIDNNFEPGEGADDIVYNINSQPDGTVLIAGKFKNINQTRRVGIARLLPHGPVDTSFMDTAYNQFAGVITSYNDPNVEPPNFIFTTAVQPDGNILIGGRFTHVGGGWTRDDVCTRWNVARLIGGATPGPGNIELAQNQYFADDFSTNLFITLMRTNGHLGPASVTVQTATLPEGPGAAVRGQDFDLLDFYQNPAYITTYPATYQAIDGTFGQNQSPTETVDPGRSYLGPANDVWVSIYQSTNTGNKHLNLELTNPNDTGFQLGGEHIPLGVALGRRLGQLEIVDSHRNHGVLSFSAPTYISAEATNAVITVVRTGGSDGTVTIQYATSDGTATNNIHYYGVTNTLTFGHGVTNLSFIVQPRKEILVDGDHTINLRLQTPMGGATMGVSNAVLTLVDDDKVGGVVEFSAPTYATNENAGVALITVNRHDSHLGILSVWFATSDGSALSGLNYTGSTNLLTWGSGDVKPKTLALPIFADGVENLTNLTVNLRLVSAAVNGVTNSQYLGTNAPTAVLTLVNSDFRGKVAFSAPSYSINENGGFAIIPVVRTDGAKESISVNFAAVSGTALEGADFLGTNGTLYFGPGELCKTFTVPVINNIGPDLARFVTLTLSGASPTNALGAASTALLNILDDESIFEQPGTVDATQDPSMGFDGNVYSLALQPDGKLLVGGDFTQANGLSRNRLARLETDGSLDQRFSSTAATAGANDSVLAIRPQTDGRIVIGGRFTVVNGVNRFSLARLTAGGFLDTTFNPGDGANGPVFAVAEAFVGGERKLLVGGTFTSFGSVERNYLVRLNDDGAVDATFSLTPGANGTVHALAIQTDGKVLVGGDFTAMNGTGRSHLARLNVDGSLDLSFNPALSINDSVRAIALQMDGRILIGGLFTNVNGVVLNHIACLTPNGEVDSGFTPGLGANDLVSSIAVQGDTRIVLGGQFTSCNGVTRGRLTRLYRDGTVDPTINFGTGADGFVSAVLVQVDGKLLLGGGFTHYDGEPRARLARIYGGATTGPGTLEFSAENYLVDENGTNVLVSVRRRGGTAGTSLSPNVSVTLSTANGTAIAGSNYTAVVTNLVFPVGEVLCTVAIPVARDFVITPDLTVHLTLSNPLPAVQNGPTLGNQSFALLTIYNDDSALSFGPPAAYANPENYAARIPVVRSGSFRLPATVEFLTTTNGTAKAGVNYTPVRTTVAFAAGQSSNFVQVPLIHNPGAEGDKTVELQLTNALNALLFSPSFATLTIVDIDNAPGQLVFGSTNIWVNEADGYAFIPVLRTNGRTGIISVQYATQDGTARAGLKYAATNDSLTFANGETSKVIAVPIFQEGQVEGDTTFSVNLLNPTGGASLLTSTVKVTIRDDDVGFALSSPVYIGTETDGSIILAVNRVGTNGVNAVSYATTNGTAVAGTNYQPTLGRLTFTNGESLKTFSVPVIHDPLVTGPLSFTVSLFDASPGTQIYANNPATVTINDADPGLYFTNANFYTTRSASNVLVTVVRSNANTGVVAVKFATTNDTAVVNRDYYPTNGTLTFSNGVALQSFTVAINTTNRDVSVDRSFLVLLSEPSAPAQLLAPSTALVTITNEVAGLNFSSPVYTAAENGHLATITVVRTGYTNSTVAVDYATATLSTNESTAIAGVNYVATSGTLTFTNGEMVKTFTVTVLDNSVLDGDKSLDLILSNVRGNAELLDIPAAKLAIIESDGSLIVPAGTALLQESGPVNGMIDPGETVTMLFGLRNTSGTNTVNLVAELLATNGVAAPSSPQNYGALAVRGHSASRPFTFTANATNGQVIKATFLVRDGNSPTNYVPFNLIVGRSSFVYSNTAPIVINDAASATPYPSAINVAAPGVVAKATVTLTNLYHSWPRDVSALLVSPTGQKSYLMAKAGGSFSLNKVTLTFDDDATASLPTSGITSGTYRPGSYAAFTPIFPSPAPVGPYSTNLAAFNNVNPNGNWSIFVIDDSTGNAGVISNGWVLNLTTATPILGDADLDVSVQAAGSPVIVSSNATYTVKVTNYGPAAATNIVLTDSWPTNAAYVAGTTSIGTVTNNAAGQMLWSIPALAKDASATLTLVLQPMAVGSFTNTVRVTSLTNDPNPDDDSAVSAIAVIPPAADLAMSLAGASNPVMIGQTFAYTLTVSNLGPATATGVAASATLPAGISFLTATPAGVLLSGNVVTFTNLGNLASGAFLSTTVGVRATASGTLTASADGWSATTDLAKINNHASVKTVVNGVPMSVTYSGSSLTLSWPVDASGYALEYATNLVAPIFWMPLTNPAPTAFGAQKTVTLPADNQSRFYRLRAPMP